MNLDFDTRLPFTNCRVVGNNVNPADYHAENVMRGMPGYVLTRSSLLAFNSCPKKWINGWKTKDTESTLWGSLIDCLILTPSKFDSIYAVEPMNYPAPKDCTAVKKGKCKEGDPIPWDNKSTFCKEWTLKQGGKEAISSKIHAESMRAINGVGSDEKANDLIVSSDVQVWIEGEYFDNATKLTIRVKCLIDLVPSGEYENSLADFKTTRSAHPSTWAKMVSAYGYDAQAAICLDLYSAATGEDRNTFLHVIQENTPPYQTARRMLSMEFVALGRSKVKQALERYCYCLKNNRWPDWDEDSPFNGWSIVEVDPWMIKNLESPHQPIEEEAEEKTQEEPLYLN